MFDSFSLDHQTSKAGTSLTVSTVVIAVVLCAVFLFSVTLFLVIIIAVLKRKYHSKKEERKREDEHDYESVSDLPISIPLKSTLNNNEVVKNVKDTDKDEYDYVKCNEDASPITVVKNDAYTCTSFKRDDESIDADVSS